MNRLKTGAQGVGAAALGTDPADEQTVARRRGICAGCDRATKRRSAGRSEARVLSAMSQCKVCQCNLKLKTSLAREKCPLGKW